MDENKNLFKKIENTIGYTLPKEFKKVYLDEKMIKKLNFMSLEEVYDEICFVIDENLEDEEDDEIYTIEPQKTILAKAYDKKRVPFMQDESGNFIGIDFNPGKEGIIGQIINYGRDEYDMKVFAFCLKDFIEGIKEYNIDKDTYITIFLLDNNIKFLKTKKQDTSIKKLSNDDSKKIVKMEIEEEKIDEEIKTISFKMDYLKDIIDMLTKMNNDIKNNQNVKSFNNYWFDYRVINKRDSLCHTTRNKDDFYNIIESFSKEELKGFSFAILNGISELKGDILYIGEEKIFVEFNILKNIVLIRYTETIGNEIMKETFEKIKKYFDR